MVGNPVFVIVNLQKLGKGFVKSYVVCTRLTNVGQCYKLLLLS
jgi:hypothetical protein